jgi:tetratricopeptide (TPR) repeat protein
MRREYLIAAVLVLVTVGIYWPVMDARFLDYDDNMYIIENAHVQSGLKCSNVAWAFTTGYAANWHPLTWISHMLDCQLYGMDSGKHHLTNLIFHVANTLLLFALLRMLTGALWRSALVAALFAWHPTHVESVAWIAERKDVLSTFFGLLTLMAYARYATGFKVHPPPPKATEDRGLKIKVYYGLALVCFALGLMAKPMLVTLPFVMLLLDFWPLRRVYDLRFTIYEPNLKAGASREGTALASAPVEARKAGIGGLILEKAPFFALAAASSVTTYLVQKAGGAESVHPLPAGMRVANALISYVRYLGNIFWPTRLAVLYPAVDSWPMWEIIGAVLLLLGLTLVALRMARRRPYSIVGWLWFLGMLVPVIGLVQVGEQSIADRYLYLPAVGIFMATVWGLTELTAAWPETSRGMLASLAIGGCVLASCNQVNYWRDGVTLFQHALAVTRKNAVAAFDLGQMFSSAGRVKEAVPYYEEELRIKPDDDRAYNNIGLCLAMQGQLSEATNYYAQSLKHHPKPSYAASTHFNYSLALSALGDTGGAIEHALESVRLEPKHAQEQCATGRLLMNKGRFEEAKAHLETATKLKPDYIEARVELGLTLTELGDIGGAAEQYELVLRQSPDSLDALNNLAWIRATEGRPELRNGAEAVRLGLHACELTQNGQPALLGTLAAAYAEAGQFAEAQATARTAAELATANGQSDLAKRNRQLLELYQSNRAYHEIPAQAKGVSPPATLH